MKRRFWLKAIFTALFVLQAPLCALACLDESGNHSVAETTATPTHHACHEEDPGSSPSSPANSHEDCGCEFTANALVPQSGDVTTTPIQVVLPLSMRDEPIASSVSWEASVAYAFDLPPPDILLLKQTLLI